MKMNGNIYRSGIAMALLGSLLQLSCGSREGVVQTADGVVVHLNPPPKRQRGRCAFRCWVSA